jgi:hypothetical protein
MGASVCVGEEERRGGAAALRRGDFEAAAVRGGDETSDLEAEPKGWWVEGREEGLGGA